MKAEIKVYPNPTNSFVFMNQYSQFITDIKVFDIYGKEQSVTIVESGIDLSDLSSGIYFFDYEEGRKYFCKRDYQVIIIPFIFSRVFLKY